MATQFQRVGAVAFFVLFTMQSTNAGDNWAHWRGPSGNGVALDGSPPTDLQGDSNLKWKVELPGKGSGSPVVWGNKIFVVAAVPTSASSDASDAGAGRGGPPPGAQGRGRPGRGNQGGRGRRGRGAPPSEQEFQLLCINRDNGAVVWKQTVTKATPHQGTHPTNSHASASPCTDGNHVYAHFGSRGLFCYDMDGALVWKRNDFGQMDTRNSFGEGSSPTLAGNLVIVPWDHEGESSLYALDKLTGKTVWRTERDEPTCWATPLVVEHNGTKQVIMNGQNYARGYDLASGKELWRCSGQTDRPAASAVSSDGMVFLGSGYRGAFLGAFRLGGKGDIRGSDQVAWTVSENTPDIASPLLSGGRLYYFKARTGILTCVDAATGSPHYETRRIGDLGEIYASPVAAGGHVYLCDRDGTVVVIKDATEFEEVAVAELGETIDASPAVVGDELIIRGERHLFCFAQ